MKNHFLDILIPEYNCSENDMTNLLNSIIRQKNVDLREIGVIVVNDNSPRKFKNSFFRRFPRLDIEYYIKETNDGVGLTRQYALDKSQAEYITFVDQDDELYGNESLYKVINQLKQNRFDVLYTKYIEEVLLDDGKIFNYVHKLEDPTEAVHGLFVKREKIIEIGLKFVPGVRYNDDFYYRRILFTLLCPYSLDEITYLWKFNKNSVVRKERKYDYAVEEYYDFFKALKYKISFLKSKKAYIDENNFCSILGCFITLESNLFNFEELRVQKKQYEKELYELICDNSELVSKSKFEFLYSRQLEATKKQHLKLEVNEDFFSFLDRMQNEYPDIKFEYVTNERLIDLIVPYSGNNDKISELLNSTLFQLACKTDEFGVIIIDDMSKLPLQDSFLKNYTRINVDYFKNQNPVGFVRSSLYGVQKSSAKYVLFLDDNSDLYDNFVLSNLIEFVKENNYDMICSKSIKFNGLNFVNYQNMNSLYGNIFSKSYILKLFETIDFKNDYYDRVYFDNIIKHAPKKSFDYDKTIYRLKYFEYVNFFKEKIIPYFDALYDSTLLICNDFDMNQTALLYNIYIMFLIVESDHLFDIDIGEYENKIYNLFDNIKDFYFNSIDESHKLFNSTVSNIRNYLNIKEIRKTFDDFINEKSK